MKLIERSVESSVRPMAAASCQLLLALQKSRIEAHVAMAVNMRTTPTTQDGHKPLTPAPKLAAAAPSPALTACAEPLMSASGGSDGG